MTLQIPELPPLPSNLFDLLRAISKTLRIKLSHEKAMSATERGRRSGGSLLRGGFPSPVEADGDMCVVGSVVDLALVETR